MLALVIGSTESENVCYGNWNTESENVGPGNWDTESENVAMVIGTLNQKMLPWWLGH